jgi:hypothetical protein
VAKVLSMKRRNRSRIIALAAWNFVLVCWKHASAVSYLSSFRGIHKLYQSSYPS